MEQKYKSLSIFEFAERFPNNDACINYLAELKWPTGFICERCGNEKYCRGSRKHTRQCTKCKYQASPTSGTLFHKVKFPVLKAFYIIYYMSTSKKGIASTELSRKLELRQKTCWLFQQKVMKAMASSGKYPLQGMVEVDETVVGGEEKNTRGRQNKNKKLLAIGIERKGKGISRMYGKVIVDGSSASLKQLFNPHISTGAIIRTDGWTGYNPLKKDFPNLHQENSGTSGENFKEMHRAIMMFKAWLRGIHHSVKNLQAYVDEYTYRFNRGFMKEYIFENLMGRMIDHQPCSYNLIRIY
jgi:ISXO2-like transposase domain/Transposase zinc-ribbon domain